MRDWVHVWAVLAVSMLMEELAVTEEALDVTITVNYTRPPGSDLGTDEYRAASGPVTVTCNSGGAENVTYLWSSTCKNCVFDNSTEQKIFRAAVHSGDNGTHTCTVTMESNETVVGNASINFNIVGAGIHVFRGNSTGDVGSLSNNGVIISSNTDPQYHFRFFCRSDSLKGNVGTLIGPNGCNVTTNGVFNITNPQPGELLVESRPVNQSNLTASDQGVYTCRIPLQSGVIKNINIGIYPSGFRVPPRITSVTRGSMSSNVTCISTGSPATNVTWMRNGQPLTIDGSLYLLTQIVVDRSQSTYENVLTVPDSDIDRCSLVTCTVTNALGHDSQTYSTSPSATPPRATISAPGRPTAGEAFSLTCTVIVTVGDPPSVQWTRPNGSIIQETTTDDCTTTYISTLELSPVRTSHGGLYKCKANSTGGNSLDTNNLIVQIPPPTLTVSRDPDDSVILRHGDPLTLTCSIQLDPSVDSDVMVTGRLQGAGRNSTTVTTSEGVYRIMLYIPSLRATFSDTYTCTATVEPGSGVMYVQSSESRSDSLNISVGLVVSITVSYTSPPGAELGPNQYRAASGPVTVTCTAEGGTGPVSYQWSSTCRDCPFQTATSSYVTRVAVHSGDTGIHTCTATSGSISGNKTVILLNVVGAGIHVFRGASTGDLQVPGSLPNNGIVISLNTTEDRVYFRFFCRSDSMIRNVGMFIGPNGTAVTTGDVFTIACQQPGELIVENTLSQNVLTARDQGVYTCHIPLQSGVMRDINVGIYPSGFNTPPSIIHLGFTYGFISSTLTCISTGSPATNVTWMRDGQPLTLNGSTYQLTQTVANRKLSTYENVLTINRATSDIIGNIYNCTVINALDKVSRTLIAYPPPTVTISPPEIAIAGESFSLTCTVTLAEGDSLIGEPTVQWIVPDGVSINSDMQQVMTNYSTYTSTVEFTPVQTSHGGQYTCQATSTSGTSFDAKIVTVQIVTTVLFQLRILPIGDCATWVVDSPDQKFKEIISAVINAVSMMCSCIFTQDNIQRNEFSCRSIENTVVFRAEIKYASFTYTAAQLVDFISQWVQSAPSFVVGPSMSRVNVDTSCPTQLDSFLSEDCVSMDQGKTQSIGAIVGGVLTGVCVVFISTAIVIAVVFIQKRKQKSFSPAEEIELSQDTVPMDTNPAYGCSVKKPALTQQSASPYEVVLHPDEQEGDNEYAVIPYDLPSSTQ